MTEPEWERKSITLKCRITKLRNKSKQAALLATKLDLNRQRKQAEDELLQHKLDFHKLTRS